MTATVGGISGHRYSWHCLSVPESQLSDGSTLSIEISEPPFDPSWDWERLCWWSPIREEMMKGELNRWLYAPHFIGRINGQFAGSMSYYTPRDTRDVGIVGFVSTEEQFRRRGIASTLMSKLIRKFTSQGGQALYLCTTNSIAGDLYESHGFRYHLGDGMRYLSPDASDFDDRWFAPCSPVTIREANWADIARVAVLYNHRDPAWLIKDSLSASFRDTRYESHFMHLMRQIENTKGSFFVVEASGSRIVGSVVFKRLDSFYEQHVAELSLRLSQQYFSHARSLLDQAAQRAENMGIQQFALMVAATDYDQLKLAARAGFVAGPCWPRRLYDNGRFTDMRIMLRDLKPSEVVVRTRDSFYGERQPWQQDRIASETMPTKTE